MLSSQLPQKIIKVSQLVLDDYRVCGLTFVLVAATASKMVAPLIASKKVCFFRASCLKFVLS
jgi:hypothetical protein